jgi:steroid 5-alpha reductase family enzyme
MALPVVRNLVECADYSNTVAPYINQLRPLPQVLLESFGNAAALKQLYLDTNPLITSIAFALFISPIFLVVSEINKNYSQVDRVWSILPTIWNLHYTVYAHLAGLPTARTDAVAIISSIWSVSFRRSALGHLAKNRAD